MEEGKKSPEEIRALTRMWLCLGASMISQMEAHEQVMAEVANKEYEKEFGNDEYITASSSADKAGEKERNS